MKRALTKSGLVMLLTGLLTGLVAGSVLGAGTLTEIRAFLNTGVNVVVNGKVFEAVDPANGTKYVPITYQDRTYLPLRAVAEAVGLQVTWDPNTQTAYLGAVGGEIDPNAIRWTPVAAAMSPKPQKYRTKARHAEELTLPNGTTFDYGFVTDGDALLAQWYTTDFQYRKFRARFYFWDDNEDSRNAYTPTLKFVDENEIPIKEFTGAWGEVLEVEIDIADVQTLWISADGDATIMGNPELGQ